MNWINSEPKIPVGLKYSDSETYIEFNAFPKERKALLTMMNPHNVNELLNLFEPLSIRLEKEFDIEYLYQVMDVKDFSILINNKWKEFENELIVSKMDENYNFVGCKIELFKKCLYLALY